MNEKIKTLTPDEYLDLIISYLKDNNKYEESFDGLLSMIYEAYSTFYKAKETIAREGLTLINSMGKPVANPLIKVESDAMKNVFKAISELGISPTQLLKNKKLASKSNDDDNDDAASLIEALTN